MMARRLGIAFFISLAILIAEVGGGIATHSLALLGDAGHVLSDLVALGLSWYGIKQAERPADFRMTYGYHRVGIFTAFVNAAVLVAVSGWIVIEAYQRLLVPQVIQGDVMFVIGVGGLVANTIVISMLGGHTDNLNVQSAFLHVVGDTLGSLAVVVSAAVIFFTGQSWVDSIASFFIAGVVTVGSVRIIMRSIGILLEASPKNVDMGILVQKIYSIPGVKGVHHLHIWSLTPEILALSCHLIVDDIQVSEGATILTQLNEMLEKEFAIGHSTVQLEVVGYDPNELYCSLDMEGEPLLVAHSH